MTRRTRQSGFTIVELMISLTVSSVLIMLAVKVQGAQQHSIVALRTRAYAVAELRMAVEWLRHDMAAGDIVSWQDPWLKIEREGPLSSQYGAWTGSWDFGVSYRLDVRNLLRIDWKTAEAHAVATGITTFQVSESGGEVTIRLGVGDDDEMNGRTVDLVWVNG
jgi:prepilin-type N-terminal cleavage/methylation domain-containing protein